MGKIIMIILIGLVVYFLFIRGRELDPLQNKPKKKDKNKQIEDTLVQCAKCDVFVSDKEALIKDGKYFCSKDCAK